MINKTIEESTEFKELEKVGYGILLDLLSKVNHSAFEKNPENINLKVSFSENYILRYENCCEFIKIIAPSRLEDFKFYYLPDKIRRTKNVYYENYTLKDYIEKLGVRSDKQESMDLDGTAFKKLKSQFQILQELKDL